MKIGITCYPTFGGSGVVATELGVALAAGDHFGEIALIDEGPRMAEVAAHAKLDLLHVHYALPHAISALLARGMLEDQGARLKVLTTLHGTDITIVGQDRSYLPITRFGIEKSDGEFTHVLARNQSVLSA